MTEDRIKRMDEAIKGLYEATKNVGTPSINKAIKAVIDTWKDVSAFGGEDPPDNDELYRR